MQINWLPKPTDPEQHSLQWQGISGFSKTMVQTAKVSFFSEPDKLVKTETDTWSRRIFLSALFWPPF